MIKDENEIDYNSDYKADSIFAKGYLENVKYSHKCCMWAELKKARACTRPSRTAESHHRYRVNSIRLPIASVGRHGAWFIHEKHETLSQLTRISTQFMRPRRWSLISCGAIRARFVDTRRGFEKTKKNAERVKNVWTPPYVESFSWSMYLSPIRGKCQLRTL